MKNRSRWIRVMANNGTDVVVDGDSGWFIIWEGVLARPVFNSKGAAEICLQMYKDGRRRPEL